ncbi:hypothetical protein AJ80_01070 [Polytolypa hystricis UAMH7299]|uniref:HypA-like protein n=1 Tax=Polytolypa hystricis (strain UAMH7299) TaxID=1447883 RepID=A0A2B7YSU7_POLH7|nr:hypothetical protein AJ80_01070 [Polytolypa hystricis UAMH7299]
MRLYKTGLQVTSVTYCLSRSYLSLQAQSSSMLRSIPEHPLPLRKTRPITSPIFINSTHIRSTTSQIQHRSSHSVSFRQTTSQAKKTAARAMAMATATQVHLTSADKGVYHLNPRDDAAKEASRVLQEDLETHHIYFNDSGFHNHIVHHILSIYALGASPEEIKAAFKHNIDYQRPSRPVDEATVQKLSDKEHFKRLSGLRSQYPNFLVFFQREIEAKGVGAVLNEYLFKGDEYADSMYTRLFGGLIHPFIHLGFGIEFNQPAIIAQGLAQTATHDLKYGTFLLAAEKKAGGVGQQGGTKSLVQLLREIREDEKLSKAAHWEDENKFFDGVMTRAPEEMVGYASQFKVAPEQIDEKMAELVNAVGKRRSRGENATNTKPPRFYEVYYTTAAQNPQKQIKFDFFYIHSLNSSIFLPAYLSQPWLDTRNKCRLLEWKGRIDLFMYASRSCAEPRMQDIINYKPTRESWEEISAEVRRNERDDGHAAKFVRALAFGEGVSKPYEGKGGFLITKDMWITLGNMVIDSIHDPGRMWIRSTGFDEAWTDVADRPSA